MKRTTIYLDSDLEAALKRETQRQDRPMAEIIRDAVRAYVNPSTTRRPPGAGAFDSGHTDTSTRVDALLDEFGFGKDQ